MKYIKTFANWPVIVGLGLVLVLFNAYLFPSFKVKLNKTAGQEVKILDTRFSYDFDTVNMVFQQMGEKGRQLYLREFSFYDRIYPSVYGFFLLFLIIKLMKSFPTRLFSLCLLFPMAAGFFDYAENHCIQKMMHAYDQIPQLVSLSILFTRLKFLLLVISILIVLGLIVRRFLWVEGSF